jgi:cytochrome P450
MDAVIEPPQKQARVIDESRLPPRPELSRYMMAFGFILHPTRFLEACQEDCGDFFTLRPTPDRKVVFTVDPDAVKQIFTGDPNVLYAGAGNIVLAPILGPGSTLLLDGAEHLRHRRLLLPPFHGERMRRYGEVMTEVTERHIAQWPRDKRFAVMPSMQAVTLEIIMRVVFGVDDPDRLERLGKPLRRLLDMVATRRSVLALGITAGRNGRFSPWTRFQNARAEADVLLNEEIRARRSDPTAPDRDDIFSMLCCAQDEDGHALTEAELRDELMTLLVAGHETTATALAWTLERVSRHPDVLAQMLSEQREGGDEYLDAVIKESLRLRPVVPAVARELQAPMTLGPWDLPAGVNVAPSIYLLHRRPDLYPDPTAFKPERFVGRNPGTYEWIPFGGGVRRCLGASFALFEMKAVLATILREVQLAPSARSGESTQRRAITLAPARGGRIAVGT